MTPHVVPPSKACALSQFQPKRLLCIPLPPRLTERACREQWEIKYSQAMLPFILINNISVMLKHHIITNISIFLMAADIVPINL